MSYKRRAVALRQRDNGGKSAVLSIIHAELSQGNTLTGAQEALESEHCRASAAGWGVVCCSASQERASA